MSDAWAEDLIRSARLARSVIWSYVRHLEGRGAEPSAGRVGRALVQLDRALAHPEVTLLSERIAAEVGETKATVTPFRRPKRQKRP